MENIKKQLEQYMKECNKRMILMIGIELGNDGEFIIMKKHVPNPLYVE